MNHQLLLPRRRAGGASSLLTDLAAFWKLDEASGTRFDATETNADLTDNNTVTQEAGKIGNAAKFTAASAEYLSRDNASTYGLNPGDTAYTRAGWFKCVDASASQLIYTTSDGLSGMRFAIISNAFFADILNSGTVGNVTHTLPIVSDTWYCVRAFHDPDLNVIGLAINGGAAQTGAMSGPATAAGTDIFTLGAGQSGALPFDGAIDAFGHWNRLWTAAEWAAFYNGGAGVEWPF